MGFYQNGESVRSHGCGVVQGTVKYLGFIFIGKERQSVTTKRREKLGVGSITQEFVKQGIA